MAEEETNEVTRYLAEPRASAGSDPLDWWRDARYGALKLMAKDYLAILASSAAIESEFSRVSDTVNPRKRNRLSKQRINEMSCLRSFQRIKDLPIPDDEDESDASDFPVSTQDELESQSGSEDDISVFD